MNLRLVEQLFFKLLISHFTTFVVNYIQIYVKINDRIWQGRMLASK